MIIKNGTLFDGSGKKAIQADIRVEGDKITQVGTVNKKDDHTIDAEGMYVMPGFCDILNHSDAYATLFDNPAQESLLQQGITTILTGTCGSSLAPLTSGVFINSIQKWGDTSKINVNWSSMAEYLQELERHEFGPNIATLAGHSTMRRSLVQDEHRQLTDEEMGWLVYMAERSLQEGAFGVSFGLAYAHGKPATKNELLKLAKIVKKHNGLWAAHIRNEDENFLDAVKEQAEIAQNTSVNMELSHLKVIGKNNWPQYQKALNLIADIDNLNFDIYPYDKSASVLYAFLPKWATEGGNASIFKNINNANTKQKLIQEMKDDGNDYAGMTIAMGAVDKTYAGKTIQDIAHNQNTTPEEATLNLIVASENRLIVFNRSISEDNLKAAIENKKSFVSADSVGYKQEDRAKGQVVHPRYFGAMPHFLKTYAQKLGWETAVNKATYGPAQKIGLQNRGLLHEDYFADIVILNPHKLNTEADFENPYQYPQGIEHVIVNGKVAIEKGNIKDLGGKVLKRNS